MRLVVSSTLILLYSLFVLANLYAVVMGELSVTSGIFTVLSILAIVALTGKGRSNSRFSAYVLCGLLGIAGILLIGHPIWVYAHNVPTDPVVIWVGPIVVFVVATSYWVIRTGKEPAPHRATEFETR